MATFCTGLHFGLKDTFDDSLMHKNVVYELLPFRPKMHPCCFKTVLLLEDDARDDNLLLSAKLQQQAPVAIAVTNAVSAKYSFLGIGVFFSRHRCFCPLWH